MATDSVQRYYGERAYDYGWWFRPLAERQTQLALRASGLRDRESLLDVGCGPARYARPLGQRGHEVWGVDCCPEMVAVARQSVALALVADVQQLRLPRRFDVILCLGVLELLPDPVAALVRLREHLVSGGRLVVLVPSDTVAGRLYQIGQRWRGLAVRLFSPEALEVLAATAGLRCRRRASPFLHNFLAVMSACEGRP